MFSPSLMVYIYSESLRNLYVMIWCRVYGEHNGDQGHWEKARGRRWCTWLWTPYFFPVISFCVEQVCQYNNAYWLGKKLLEPRFGKRGPAGPLRNGSPHLAGPINPSLKVCLLSCEHMHKPTLHILSLEHVVFIIMLHSTSSRSYSGKAQL